MKINICKIHNSQLNFQLLKFNSVNRPYNRLFIIPLIINQILLKL